MRTHLFSAKWTLLIVAGLSLACGKAFSSSEGQNNTPQIAAPAAVPLPVPVLPPLSRVDALQGMIVADIRFQGPIEDKRVLQHIREEIKQKVGAPLDRQEIRRSLKTLYATGRFSNIQVQAEPTVPNQVVLVFALEPNYFIGTLTAEGAPRRMTNGQLVDSTKLQLGEIITKVKVDQAILRMKSLLADNGYFKAEVTSTGALHQDTQLTDLHFKVVAGEQAHIGQIVVQGDAGLTVQEVAVIADLESGHTVTRDRLSKGLQKLKREYTKQGRLESQISIVDHTYHPDRNAVDYTLKILRGPTVDINVEGASLSKGQLRRYVPVYEESAVDDDLLNEGRRDIRDYLQTQGYFDAKVNFVEDFSAEQNHLNVIYDIDRGLKHDLVRVLITIKPGTSVQSPRAYFEEHEIRDRLQVQQQSRVLSHGRFSQSLMNSDVENITALYKSAGFLQVKVEAELKDDYLGKAGQMLVVYDIDEGPQTTVASLQLVGNDSVKSNELLELLSSGEGQPYSEANVAVDRDAILNYYFDHGFPEVQFEGKVTPAVGQPERMDVIYTIHEGRQEFVDRVLSSDLQYTKKVVVDRQMEIAPGDPLSQSQMLKTQSNLYNLGIFNEVKMAVQNPEGDSKYKDVLIQFQEARRWTFNYGVGLEASTGQPSATGCAQLAKEGETTLACSEGRTGVSPRVSFDVSRINFRGRAHTISLQSHVGRLQKQVLLSDDTPRWFGKDNWKLTLTGLYDNSINVTTFTSERLEGSMQVEQKYSKVDTFLYRFTYRRVKASNVVVSPDQIPLYSTPVRIGIPSFTYLRDKRDNPVDTKNGNFTTFDTGVASSVFGSEANFGRFLIQNSTYQSFQKKRWVFARNTRIGVEEPWGSTVIPLPERFLAGGTNSLRGFALNQAGPRDLTTGSPLGGDALFVNSLELRTPPVLLPYVDDNLGFVLFHDFGNVFTDGNEMLHSLFRWYQPRREDCSNQATANLCSFAYMTNTLGAGIRYKTPIGPIRMDVGYNLNPPTYPTTEIGPDGNPVFASHTTRRVNFFFSIGQTF